jgi:heptosyltransferase-2
VSPKKILIVQTAFLGDVILTLPLLQEVKSLFPRASIDFITIPSCRNILETVPEIDTLWVYDKRHRESGFRNSLGLTRRLRRKRYDVALVPHRSLRSALLVWASGIPLRIGFDRSAGKFLFHTVIPYPHGIHEIRRNLHLLHPFGLDSDRTVYPKLHFTEDDRKAVHSWLSRHGIDDRKAIVAVAPGSVWTTKRWPSGFFGRLIRKLQDDDHPIVLIGGDGDRAVVDRILETTGSGPFDAVGRFTVRQSALLIRKSRILITNDTAPMHLAVAVGTPSLAIFGSTVPALGFYPCGPLDRVIENTSLDCRPCGPHGRHECPLGTLECMNSIEPDDVFREAREMLAASADAPDPT